ncbi:MAG: beta-N-acetylhexosaminidase [Clostridia bacterium]|nr:beta-N-acetylhexosaminidase [Clostridia bacterium]
MKLWFTGLTAAQMSAVAELADMVDITITEDGYPVHVERGDTGLELEFTAGSGPYTGRVTLRYHREVELYRGIGRLVDACRTRQDVKETPAYTDLCAMYEVSANAVMTPEMVKRVIRHLALMGYSSMMLYVEDCYEVEGYPYFGYMRGRYTREELKEFDAYAARFGIELIPCIQVLAHLLQAMRWAAHRKMHDCEDILLVDEPETYRLIEAMFDTVSACFTSRRINVGMDEAWMLGCGKYFKKHGYVERTEILKSHLSKVMDIVKAHGFSPMMWSDMYFSAAFDHNDYYYAAEELEDPHMPQSVLDIAPPEMSLIYWDYGNFYPIVNKMAKLHREFPNPVWFAGGATKWAGYAPMNQFSLWCSRDQLRACRDNGIDKIIVTVWGSNGSECAVMSILPTLQMLAEDCYAGRNDDEWVAGRFAACHDGVYEDFLLLDEINFAPGNPAPGAGSRNPSKYLLHQDVLLGLFDKHVDPATYPAHFAATAEKLRQARVRNPRWTYLFDMLIALADVLELKCTVGLHLKAAYDSGDRATLARIAEETLPEIARRLEVFFAVFEEHWQRENRIIGLEVMEIRFGGLARRVQNAIARLHRYLAGEVASLPELEEERLFYDGRQEAGRNLNIGIGRWGPTVSGSHMDGV